MKDCGIEVDMRQTNRHLALAHGISVVNGTLHSMQNVDSSTDEVHCMFPDCEATYISFGYYLRHLSVHKANLCSIINAEEDSANVAGSRLIPSRIPDELIDPLLLSDSFTSPGPSTGVSAPCPTIDTVTNVGKRINIDDDRDDDNLSLDNCADGSDGSDLDENEGGSNDDNLIQGIEVDFRDASSQSEDDSAPEAIWTCPIVDCKLPLSTERETLRHLKDGHNCHASSMNDAPQSMKKADIMHRCVRPCQATYSSIKAFKKHWNTRHASHRKRDLPVLCTVKDCGQSFLPRILNRHLSKAHAIENRYDSTIDTSKNPASCEYEDCTAAYTSKEYLKNHYNMIHNVYSETPKHCQVVDCGKKGTGKTMRKHLIEQHGCSSARGDWRPFVMRPSLDTVTCLHRGCRATYLRGSGGLLAHNRLQHANECPVAGCGRKTILSKHLARHLALAHLVSNIDDVATMMQFPLPESLAICGIDNCPAIFRLRSGSFKEYANSIHKQSLRRERRCPVVGCEAKNNHSLHLRKVHGIHTSDLHTPIIMEPAENLVFCDIDDCKAGFLKSAFGSLARHKNKAHKQPRVRHQDFCPVIGCRYRSHSLVQHLDKAHAVDITNIDINEPLLLSPSETLKRCGIDDCPAFFVVGSHARGWHVKWCHPKLTCPFCDRPYSSLTPLMKHIKAIHPQENEKKDLADILQAFGITVLRCSNQRVGCGKLFTSMANLSCHIRSEHPDAFALTCPFCDYAVSSYPALVKHVHKSHPSV